MTIYIGVLIVLLVIGFIDATHNGKITIGEHEYSGKQRHGIYISALIIAFLSGFRYENKYSDFIVNYHRVIQSRDLSWKESIFTDNPANSLLRKISVTVFHSPQAYFIIIALFIVATYVYLAKKYFPYHYYALILFYAIGIYFTSNNLSRQAIAVAIIWISWKYIVEKKFVKYCLIILLASLFHMSAIFFFPMYFLSRIRFKLNQLYIYIVLGIAIVIARYPLIRFFQLFFYSNYTGDAYGTSASNPLKLISTAIAAFFFYLLVKNHDKAVENTGIENGELLINLISHGSVIQYILSVLSATSMLMMSRLALYWGTCATASTLYAISTAKPRDRKILISAHLLYVISWFLIMEFSGKHIPTPYTPFWSILNRLS